MKQDLIIEVMQKMALHLDNFQMKQLQSAMEAVLCNYEIRTAATESSEKGKADYQEENRDLLTKFLAAKRIEGCSEKTLKYYRTTIEAMQAMLQKSVKRIMTEDLRQYLTDYQERRQSGRVTMDNIRRILSSYFAWLEDEDFIIKSPVRRIHKVKAALCVKETYTDEDLERMRDYCDELRDLAIIDMLASTGMRIGEMVLLNRRDINYNRKLQ